jgi:alkanesulfonate monooxygenase SsuD/methylene tetrahydromethanopterin reductase-like flavin-dependent oxidoreductase (luciferase family)
MTVPTLGLVIFGADISAFRGAVRQAEAAGLSSAWTTDFYTRSATIYLAAAAADTQHIRLGSAIAYGVGRSPLVLATEARSLAELAPGRITLGLGTGTRTMMRDWHDVDPSGPAVRMEELVPLLRELWSMDDRGVRHDGRFFHVNLRPTAELQEPIAVPVHLAGVNERLIEAAGFVADGHIGHPLFTRAYCDEVVRPALERGAARAGRTAGSLERCGYVICSVDENGDRARRNARAQIAFYAVVRTYDPILARHGLQDAAGRMRDAWSRRDVEAMIAAVPDSMLELMAVAGTPAEARDQYQSLIAGRYNHTLLYPPSFGLDQGEIAQGIDAIVATFAQPALDGLATT